jgi:hypothetical protein
LAPQVHDTLNLLRASQINPNILAYEALNGSFNWDCYPLAPPGCIAVNYKALAVWGSWASRGTDTWYLGPRTDHYRCNIYYVPETQAYRISGSAEQFLQHCQVPNLSNNLHLKALTDELQTATGIALRMHKGQTLIRVLGKAKAILNPPTREEQRMDNDNDIVEPPHETEALLPLQRISEAPTIMQTCDPMAKQNLITTGCTHRRQTQNNTPGDVPVIRQMAHTLIPPDTSSHRKAPINPSMLHHITSGYHLAFPSTWWNTSKRKIN